jgi:hypothetical protein
MRRDAVAVLLRVLLVAGCAGAALAQCTGQACGGGAPGHQAHAVPGDDVELFDFDGDGGENVTLDGSLSHSHYFQAGPPVVNGEIVKFVWSAAGGAVVCDKVKCDGVRFTVGVTTVTLTVTDQTGDAASDVIVVTVKAGGDATGKPEVTGVQPGGGSAAGGEKVTITGKNFYSNAKVTFGDTPAAGLVVVSGTQITVTAPAGGPGAVEVVVTTSVGSAGGAQYTYSTGGAGTAVAWREDVWKNADGSVWGDAQEVTGIVIGPDGRYYLSTLTGKVWAVDVGADLVVKSACSGAQFEKDRALYGIAWNPKDGANRLLVTSNTMFWGSKGGGWSWDNGKVEFVNIDDGGCVTKGGVVISGLPMSNHDHGCSKMAFDGGGGMLLTCGGATNAGIKDEAFGNIDESPLSGAILYAPYLSAGFDGAIKYSSTDPGTADVTGGDVTVYAAGFRNSFGMIGSSYGNFYALDNGPNADFGATSTSCTTQAEDANAQDLLHKVVKGGYHGHPNRNRGRSDERQCKWRQGAQAPIGYIRSSTNGIAEYTGNTFGGQIKGDLFLSQLAWRGLPGTVFRVEMDDAGSPKGNPYEVWATSGDQMVQSPEGYLVMPQIKQYKVLVLVPATGGAVRMAAEEEAPQAPEVHAVFPPRGRWIGGNTMRVTGRGFREGTVVRVGGRECEATTLLSATQIACQLPPGRGRGYVTATVGGRTSAVFGTHDYEWI